MTMAQFTPTEEGFTLELNSGAEHDLHPEEMLAVCLNSVNAYTKQSFATVPYPHRQALAAMHDALGQWLGLTDEPSAFAHINDALGAMWLDAAGSEYLLHTVALDHETLDVTNATTFRLSRNAAGASVLNMIEGYLNGHAEHGDALRLKAKVNKLVDGVIQGRQATKFKSHAAIAILAGLASRDREDRGALASSFMALVPSEHDQLLECCAILGDTHTPAQLMRGAMELDQLRLTAQRLMVKLSGQVTDIVHASKIAGKLAGLGLGIRLDSNIREVADVRAECSRLAKSGLEQLTRKVRAKMNALVGDTVVVNDISDDFRDLLGDALYAGFEGTLANIDDKELPERTERQINKAVNVWWQVMMGETMRKNALRGVVTTPGDSFGLIVSVDEETAFHKFRFFPTKA
jgi:hypothetical protein